MSLYERLTEYCSQDVYPFHMPGHKRRAVRMQDPFSFDITEIDGFDDLHHAEGILKEAESAAAELWHSSETHFLVNGSTAGILSAVCGCTRTGGTLLMARNCHRSVWHAAELGRLQTVCLFPQQRGDLNGPILPSDVEHALQGSAAGAQAVLITSPTYDGVVSDVEQIARIAHSHGIPLIVDEAHGAHFGMHPVFPESSVALGADVVIHSLHKTLPALTQTALIHLNGDLVSRSRIRHMLRVFQTSSPSYVLMASIDRCVRMLSGDGARALFDPYAARLEHFYAQTAPEGIELLRTDDPSRILLKPLQMSARQLYGLLRDRFRLQPEMAAASYVLMLSSAADDEEAFARLRDALCEIGRSSSFAAAPEGSPYTIAEDSPYAVAEDSPCAAPEGSPSAVPEDAVVPVRRMPVWQALDAPQEAVPFSSSAGAVSAEYLYLYPPGIPMVTPGEEISSAVTAEALRLRRAGYTLQGTDDYTLNTIRIIKGEHT